jgi:O-antigen ligase
VFRICGAAAAFACLILSNNRMALLALGVAGTVSYVLSGGTARKAVAAVAVATILVSLAALFHEDISVAAARSGDASEVATLTGRTEIWAVVLAMAVEAPVLGYGFGSSLFILSKHPDLFLAAAHAHNVYLEQLFTGGMIGLGLFVASIAVTIALGVKSGAAKETALMSFFVVYGFTEPIINGPINLGVIVMFLATGMILVRTAPASQGRLATPRQVAHRGEVDDRQLARDTDP